MKPHGQMPMRYYSAWIPAVGAQKDPLSTKKNVVIADCVLFIVPRNVW
jgi:hypothetical protein